MAAMSPVLMHRRQERDYLSSLNDRFTAYISKVRSLRDQSKAAENTSVLAHTQALENEILDLKALYEGELAQVRENLDRTTSEKNAKEIEAGKHAKAAADLEDKLSEESTNRRKLENALADAHRFLSEKDSMIQELRITIAQHQNALAEANKDREALNGNVNTLQDSYNQEAAARADLQAMVDKLTDQINFERDVHDKENNELKNRLQGADEAIKLAEDRLKEHDMVDEHLANTLAKVRMQAHQELIRYQEEAEQSYQHSLAAVKNQLENESKSLQQALEENIHLKATIDDNTSKMGKMESKCDAVEEQNKSLINTMEVERTQAANTIADLEGKLRSAEEDINNKIRELNHAYNASLPVDLEIEAFAGLLDAEEKRLMLELQNPAPEIISRTMNNTPSANRAPSLSRSATEHIKVALSPPGSASFNKPILARTKSSPVTLDPIPPRNGSALTSTSPLKTTPPGSTRSPPGSAVPGSAVISPPRSAVPSQAPSEAAAPTPGTAATITTKLTGPQKWSYVPNVSESTARTIKPTSGRRTLTSPTTRVYYRKSTTY